MNPTTALAQIDTAVPDPGIAEVLNWMLWACTVMGILAVVIGAAQFALTKLGWTDGGTGRALATIVGGIAMASSVSLLSAFVLGTDDTSEPSTDAPSSLDTTSPTPPLPDTLTGTTPPVADTPFDRTPVIWIGGFIAAALVLALIGYLVVRTRSHLVDRRKAHRALTAEFEAAQAVYGQVADAYAAYLADPYAIFERPLLDDTSDHLTATFIDAFADAGELRPDQSSIADPARIERFRTAAQKALRAWNSADTHARKIGMGPRNTDEQRTMRRIRAALDLALDESAPAGERNSALEAVERLSDGLVAVPDRIYTGAKVAIETTTRKQITTS